MAMSQAELRTLSDQAAQRVMNQPGTVSGSRAGWMMISTILIEAWDLYSISFLLIFIKKDFGSDPLLIGLASGAVQLGALLGCLAGGWIADKFGRKKVFITTMILFVVLALAQGFVTNMWELIIIRFLLGFPLGSDISSGYAYIMEAMPRGKREVMGNRWQGMFGIGEVIAIAIITLLFLTGMDHELLWRVGLALGAVPALALLIGRLNISDTALSLIQRGKFRKAKQVSEQMFGDSLDMLPDQDFHLERPRTRDFLKSIWSDETRRKASIFAWISNACQGAEFGAFGFYLPTILVVVGISKNDVVATNVFTLGIYCIAAVSGFVGPAITPKIGHRGISQWGYGIAFVSLLLAAVALWLDLGILLLVAAALMMWGHYWDASNGMTITSMVAPTRYKGTASGFGYLFVKFAAFVTLLLFPILLAATGPALATAIVSVISLAGFLAARFILPEVYGYVETESGGLTAETRTGQATA
ncbi:MFS transporter [Fodinicola acaciae]|uniref:MFS transporter n=1 Tax=Fodinicola acaciae TaxID=2681555 RepID=UPI001C9E48D6|nr:MFS transporter [Fodinicola acaciae]